MSKRRNVGAMALAVAWHFAAGCGGEGAGPAVEPQDGGSIDGGTDVVADDAPDAVDAAPPACSPFITNVVRVDYGAGAGFGQTSFPTVVEGPPKGGGCCQGSLNVLSLGNDHRRWSRSRLHRLRERFRHWR
jgi:hypothetical protein